LNIALKCEEELFCLVLASSVCVVFGCLDAGGAAVAFVPFVPQVVWLVGNLEFDENSKFEF
jgi:hypothetical protein